MKALLKNPYLISIITLIVFLGILKIPLDFIIEDIGWSDRVSDHLNRLTKNALIIALAIVAIKKLKLVELSGLSNRIKWSNKYLILIPFYLVAIGIGSSIGTDLSEVIMMEAILLSLAMLSVGFVEEFIFRGIIQAAFLKKFAPRKNGILISIFLPALMFGSLHLVNLDTSNIAASISQATYAFFIGASFGAILLKTNRLIPLAIMHGIIDIVFSINTLLDDGVMAGELEQQDVMSAIGSTLLVVPLFIAGLLIIRKISKDSILEKIEMSKESAIQ
jgi:membrane protease YdiL (CAAX protease family)